MRLEKGTTLLKRFELIEKLGNAAFGDVWLAEDLKTKTRITLKLINPRLFSKKADIRILKREFRSYSQVKSPYIAEVYELFDEKGLLFYTAKYIEGPRITEFRGGNPSTLLPFFVDVSKALLELHKYGLIHGNIKPGDIIIDSGQKAKLVDIGVLTFFENRNPKIKKSFTYTAPEIINGFNFDWKSDFYCMGVVMFEVFYAKLPWLTPPLFESSEGLTASVSFPEGSSPQVNKVIKKLLSIDPDNRFKDATELTNSLEHILARLVKKTGFTEISKGVLKVREPDFISRRTEMANLMELFDNFEATSIDSSVVIESPQGAGRTRFLREFEKRISSKNLKTIFFSANQSQNLTADIVDAIWESLDREFRLQLALKWRGTIPLYFPRFKSFGEFKNCEQVKHLPLANEDFFRLATLVRDFIKMGARSKPIVLLLDNFDHVDKRSLRIMQEISSGTDNSIRLFTVVTIDPASGSNIEIPALSKIILSPFTFSETRTFIEDSLDHPASRIDNELFLWLYRNSRGLAKQVRSLLFLLIEEKAIYSSRGHIFLSHSQMSSETGIDFLLKKKIDSLSEKERIVLKTCSIYKKFGTKEALAFLTEEFVTQEELERILKQLEANYLIVVNRNGKITIVNKQFQPAIYQTLSKKEKARLHKKMGDYITLTWQDLLAMNINHFAFAAYHYNQAGELEKALKLYLFSVGGSMAQFNSEFAETSVDEALEIIKHNPKILKGKKLYAVYLFAGRIYYKLGIYKKAVPLLEKSFEVWKEDTILEDLIFSLANDSDSSRAIKFIAGYNDDSPDKKAVKHYLRSFVSLTIENNYTKSHFHLTRALGYIKKGHDKLFGPIRKFTLKQLQFDLDLFMNTESFDKLDKLRIELIENAKNIESKSFLIDAMNTSFQFYWNYNEMKKAYNILHESLKLSLEIFDNYRITRSYLNLANCSHRLGRLNDARFYLDKALEYAGKGSGIGILKQCYCNYGELAIIKGEFSLAENYLYNAEEISEKESNDPDLIVIYSLQTILSLLKNETGAARNIGGKLRRYTEQFKTVGQSKLIAYYSALMLLEALTGNDKEFFYEIDNEFQKLLSSYPLFKKANELLYITCKIIFFKRNNDRNSAMNLILESEAKKIDSTHSLYRMLYFYHGALLLKEAAPSSSLLKKYITEGIKFSMQIQANQFTTLFNSLSYFLETDETENIINKIRYLYLDTNADEESKSMFESEISKLSSHIQNSKNQIEYLETIGTDYSTIIDIVKSIAGRTDFNRITETVIKKMIDALTLEICGVVVLGGDAKESGYLILDSVYNEYKMSDFRFKAGVISRMLKTGRLDFVSGTPSGKNFEYRTVAAIPIALKGSVKSYIYIERDSSLGAFKESEIKFLETLSESIAVIFDNIELMQIATIDNLTKLYTRRHFMGILSKEVEKADRYKFTISMIMLDIDHFKKINDTYGHLAGDSILRILGELLKKAVRLSDYVGRFGGEEFVILLAGTDLEGAYQTAEKIRKTCEKEQISGISFTVSLGVASFHEDKVKGDKDFIEKCDMALYRAKNLGRNRTVKYCELTRSRK
ncbi:MAG: diguanylate cyclase [bacterium]